MVGFFFLELFYIMIFEKYNNLGIGNIHYILLYNISILYNVKKYPEKICKRQWCKKR